MYQLFKSFIVTYMLCYFMLFQSFLYIFINRAFLKQLEDELNIMWNRARLCIEGLQLFDGATKQNFEKYLLQSIGTDITNRIFLFNTDDKMTGIEKDKELTKVFILFLNFFF